MAVIKVGVVDDHALFLEGIRLLMSKIEETELLFDAQSGSEALEILEKQKPDVLLLDLDMPEMNGIDTFKRIHELYPQLKVLILTMHREERMISYLMELGASGYLLKDSTRQVLRDAIISVHEKGMYYSDNVSRAILSGLKRRSRQEPKLGQTIVLSRREQEILELIAEGYPNKEIADKLFISDRTVDGHRTNLLQKFNVHNTAKLVMEAVRKGFLQG